MDIMFYSSVHLCSLIKRIRMYMNMYSFNRTIVSFKVYTCVYTEISQNVWSWKFGTSWYNVPAQRCWGLRRPPGLQRPHRVSLLSVSQECGAAADPLEDS